jgi:hypothetical protein
LASIPCSRASAEPATSPIIAMSATTSDDACRVTASTSASSLVTTLCPTSGGGWFVATRLSIGMALP